MEESLKRVLADTFALYLKAHNFHWNVEGANFSQFHDFFGTLYIELHAAIDLIAEQIRAIDAYAPGSFSRFQELSKIKDENAVPDAISMVKKLEQDNKIVLASLLAAYKDAEAAKELGLANFLQDRIDIHNKHGWMLRSYQK